MQMQPSDQEKYVIIERISHFLRPSTLCPQATSSMEYSVSIILLVIL
jgi:hypothetical protein